MTRGGASNDAGWNGPERSRSSSAAEGFEVRVDEPSADSFDELLAEISAAPEVADLAGTTVAGRYVIARWLAGGGMGEVYVADDLKVGRQVAVKVLRVDLRAHGHAVARFEREASIIRDLRHPNTVKLLDSGRTDDGLLFIVMELCSGVSLASEVASGPMDSRRVLRIMHQVCLSLDEAHARGVVHRDLKPANIFLERVGSQEIAKVLDFGIAKLTPLSTLAIRGSTTGTTLAGTLVGTPAYASPEQGARQAVDARTDFYSLGVVAYECFTGRLPFEGDGAAQLAQHEREPPRPFRVTAPGVEIDPRIEAMVMRLLAKDPKDRPSNARELADEIERLGAASIDAARGVSVSPRSVDGAVEAQPRGPADAMGPMPGGLVTAKGIIGTVLAGKFRVERVIGRGGMGIVLGARHTILGYSAAIKVVSGPGADSPESCERLLREARTLAALSSDYAVRVFDVDRLEDGTPLIVMEELNGSDLGKVLEAERSLAVSRAADYLGEACAGLAEPHRRGITHRDLKPSNLFLARSLDGTERIKILDFGISKVSGESTLTGPGGFLGSARYMPPEQLRSARHVDHTADIWSLGVILFEFLTGRCPFDLPVGAALFDAIQHGAPARLGALRPDLPAPLEAIVLRCLEKDPRARYASVLELAEAIAPFGTERARRAVAHIDALFSSVPAGRGESAPASFSEPSVATYSASAVETPRGVWSWRRALAAALLLGLVSAIAWVHSLAPASAELSDEPSHVAPNASLPVPDASVSAASSEPSRAPPEPSASDAGGAPPKRQGPRTLGPANPPVRREAKPLEDPYARPD